MLGSYSLSELSKAEIDEAFIWPQQSRYQLSTLKSRFALLKRIFSQAEKLEMIKADPFAGLKFSDFIDKAIKPKDSKLRTMDLPPLVTALEEAEKPTRFMVLLMLSFGLRIGETRQLKTRYFDVKGRQLIIPSEITKTNKELRIPLSSWFVSQFNAYLQWQVSYLGYKGAFLFPRISLRDCLDAREASKLIREFSQGEWSAHDLRKLARSSWMDLGIDYMTSEMLLNHALSKLDETYIYTHAWNQKVNAIEVWHNHLQAINKELTEETDGRYTAIPPIAKMHIYQEVQQGL